MARWHALRDSQWERIKDFLHGREGYVEGIAAYPNRTDPEWRHGHVAVVVAVDLDQGHVALAEEELRQPVPVESPGVRPPDSAVRGGRALHAAGHTANRQPERGGQTYRRLVVSFGKPITGYPVTGTRQTHR